jgi:multiple sugar transport system permease protein
MFGPLQSSRAARRRTALILIVPSCLLLAIINLYPFIYALTLSFQRYNMTRAAQGSKFVWFANYGAAFQDPRFVNSVARTLIIVGGAVAIEFTLGFILAFVLNTKLRGMDTIRKISIAPVTVMPIVSALIWFYMLNQRYGIVNWFIGLFGVPSQGFLTDTTLATLSIIVADVWQWTPFIMLVILAGLNALPEYVYEAAQIDGLSDWQQFRMVTVPLLMPVMLIIVLLRIMDAFKMFDLVYTMTQGGPAGATETMSYYIYLQAFNFFELGYAAALAILMLILITIISQIFVRWLYREEAATSA